ncbi:MAG: hypothetical protein PVJ32_06375 [Anaerolineales bacterium]|jgi:hypothetical protein
MQTTNRASVVFGTLLIGLGIFLLVARFVPGLTLGTAWPIIFAFLAIAFYLPAIFWPSARPGLAGLYIPGTILLVLGLIFSYNTLTEDWESWAFAWLLIPAGVGLGLTLASWVGKWGRTPQQVGFWMVLVNVSLFALTAVFFGEPILKSIAPALLILVGLLIGVTSFIKPRQPKGS